MIWQQISYSFELFIGICKVIRLVIKLSLILQAQHFITHRITLIITDDYRRNGCGEASKRCDEREGLSHADVSSRENTLEIGLPRDTSKHQHDSVVNLWFLRLRVRANILWDVGDYKQIYQKCLALRAIKYMASYADSGYQIRGILVKFKCLSPMKLVKEFFRTVPYRTCPKTADLLEPMLTEISVALYIEDYKTESWIEFSAKNSNMKLRHTEHSTEYKVKESRWIP